MQGSGSVHISHLEWYLVNAAERHEIQLEVSHDQRNTQRHGI